MKNQELDVAELEAMAASMAAALEKITCPDCCGPIHAFIEVGAAIHREEIEWAMLVQVFRSHPGR